ncbi:site-specific integrase [Nonlabens tegetincola]|uniref:site-specific integrase n=1 Tax=Nonlabens tegetincola TaxID=323273 RepID=UPI0015D081BB|nr:site-specific integrase [Nonlabens tegetincola]
MRYKIMMKKDYKRSDGTCKLYLELYSTGDRKRLPLDIYIKPEHWNAKSQLISKKCEHSVDLNLILDQVKSKANKIIVNYRLSEQTFTASDVLDAITNPNARVCFNVFAMEHLNNNRELYTHGTYKAHKSVLKKIKEFQNPLYFNQINNDWVNSFKKWCVKAPRKNNKNTIESNIKTFKKYIGEAENKGIYIGISHKDIKVQSVKNRITYHTTEEINKLNEYYHSSFIPKHRKVALQKYLFSCFTGLRASDLWTINADNIIEGVLAFTAKKAPNPFVRIKLCKAALSFIDVDKHELWIETITTQKTNQYLKDVARECGIKKNIHLHVARHTFATQYLVNGGNVAKLQKLLGHSNIKQTIKYVHVADNLMEKDILNLDNILNVDTH